MVNVTPCDGCIHINVCGKRDIYEKFVESANKVNASLPDGLFWYAKDCEDVIIDVGCRRFQKHIECGTLRNA